MKWSRGILLLAISIMGLVGCDQKEDKGSPPPPKIDQSIKAAPIVEKNGQTQFAISLNKNSMGSEFLLSSSMILQDYAPLFSGLKTKLVYFKKVAGDVFMFESNYGHNALPEFRQTLVLAQFSVIEENEENIIIDFNKGMSELYSLSDWNGGSNESHYSGYQHFQSFQLKNNFISSLGYKNNSAVIEQVSSLYISAFGTNYNIPLVVKYYLTPYQENPEFKITKATDQKQFAFFTTHPLAFDSEEMVVPSTKFDISKPVVFAISANTPEKFKQAVKEGVLYWNKAFGKEVLQVIDAPAGVSAPDFEYNMIQWTDSDVLGFAYADAQSDPKTGEIKHAQIFVSSVFANAAKYDAQDSLKNTPNKKFKLSLKGFDSPQNGCRFEADKNSVSTTIQALRAQDVNEERVLKVSQDFVRLVIAHEVGHTLGLRHNFAGSMTSNLDLKDKQATFARYLNEEAVDPNLILTSSIMDYGENHDEYMTGHQMGLGKIMEYDQKAIENLYYNKTFSLGDSPLFCTDEKQGVYRDCMVYDSGSSFVKSAVYSVQKKADDAALNLIVKILKQIAPAKGVTTKSLAQLDLNPEGDAHIAVSPLLQILKGITVDSSMIEIEQAYAKITDLNSTSYRKKVLNTVQSEITENGGFSKIFSMLQADFTKKATEQFAQLLNDKYKFGKGRNDQDFVLQEEDILFLNHLADKYFVKYEEAYRTALVGVLSAQSQSEPIADHPVADEFSEYLAHFMENFLTETTVAEKLTMVQNPKGYGLSPDQFPAIQVKLPEFKNSFALRTKVSEFLKSERSKNGAWGFLEKRYVSAKLHQFYIDKLSLPITKFDEKKMASRSVYRWFYENKKIMTDFEFDENGFIKDEPFSPFQATAL